MTLQNGLKKLGHLWQKCMPQIFLFVRKVAARARAEGWISNIMTQKPIEKKVSMFGCQSCFVSSFLLRKQLIYGFLAGNKYPDLPHLQGGMILATQISPLLNLHSISLSLPLSLSLSLSFLNRPLPVSIHHFLLTGHHHFLWKCASSFLTLSARKFFLQNYFIFWGLVLRRGYIEK